MRLNFLMFKNKYLIFLTVFTIVFTSFLNIDNLTCTNDISNVVFTTNSYIFKVDGQPFKLDVAPICEDFTGNILIPLRTFGELLNYSVDWVNSERKAIFQKKDKSIEVYVDSNVYLLNNNRKTTRLIIDRGRILLEHKSISEIFDVSFEVLDPGREIQFNVNRDEIRIVAKDFTLQDIYGNTFNLYETLNRNDVKLVILNFWATYCPICLKEVPNFISLNNDYKDKGVLVIGVNTDTSSTEEMRKKVIEKYGINYTVLLDTNSAVYDSYSVSGVPNLFVIDKNREIILHHIGATETYFDYLRSYLNRYLPKI